MAKIGIIGASGYTGVELLRLCASHPDLELVFATGDSQSGNRIANLYPSLAAVHGDRVFEEYSPCLLGDVEGVFVALPHGASQAIMAEILDAGVAVVDLGADFRLPDAETYARWYGEAHTQVDLMDRFAYGLTELYREEITSSRAVANPGCYPSAANLALAPLVRESLLQTDGVVVNALSGVSGAGRAPKANTTFCAVDEDATAYGLLSHRHTAEIEMVLGARALFTPHLVPMNRGILATCTARPSASARDRGLTDTDRLLELVGNFYAQEPFVVVSERSPSTKSTLGSNTVHITVRYDERTDTVLAVAALDNLTKGASGAAVQNMNLLLGLPESAGLSAMGVYP